jgi:hypothetical protein
MQSGFGFCEEIGEGCLDDDIKLLERELSAKKLQQKSCKGLMRLEISTRLYASVEAYLKVFLCLQNFAPHLLFRYRLPIYQLLID